MQQLGHTRGVTRRNHALITPDTFVRAPLPGMKAATAIVHAAPALGAGFLEYTAEFEAGGELAPAASQRFVYVREGSLTAGSGKGKLEVGAGCYAYLPPGFTRALVAGSASNAIVIEKPYAALAGVQPPSTPIVASVTSVGAQPLGGDSSLAVQALLPGAPSFDMAVNVMTFEPGAALPFVEVHVMEHGLLMLEGGGVYRLDDQWYPVTAGDFIWMGPYCPQWFGALGKKPARYLIYKDWNR